MNNNPSGYLKSLSILHLAMLMGQLLFVAIIYVVGEKTLHIDADTLKTYKMIWGVFGIALVAGSMIVYRMQTKAIRQSESADEQKLADYRKANLIRWAMLEAVVMLSAIFFFISGDTKFIMVAGMLAILFFFYKPTVIKTAYETGVPEDVVNNS